MAAYTLEIGQEHLDKWLKAELAIADGQSYSTGSRTLTRASLGEVRKQIAFWRNEVSKLSLLNNKGSSRRTMRFVPRDL